MSIEKKLPIVLSVVVFILLLLLNGIITYTIDEGQVSLTNLGFTVFNGSILQVGFSFGIYTLIMSKKDGFFHTIRKTPAMRRFKKILVLGYRSGLFTSIITIPVIVIEFDLYKHSFLFYLIYAIWFSVFVYSFSCFIYIITVFKQIELIEDKDAIA